MKSRKLSDAEKSFTAALALANAQEDEVAAEVIKTQLAQISSFNQSNQPLEATQPLEETAAGESEPPTHSDDPEPTQSEPEPDSENTENAPLPENDENEEPAESPENESWIFSIYPRHI